MGLRRESVRQVQASTSGTKGPYKKTLGKPAMHKRQMQYACYNEDDESKEEDLKDEHGELYSEEDKGGKNCLDWRCPSDPGSCSMTMTLLREDLLPLATMICLKKELKKK
ncbi:hypothetical protein LSAT2_031196 [Lamellibrachia satsuma]|nr:hypothetical protein LSAT2_031196 [Lamellibrachia satsuma]